MDVSALRMREATITAALWMSVAVGLLQWPLVPVVLVAVPLGVAAAALERRA